MGQTKPKSTAHVISHSHWDREWYLTTEQYRFRLVRMLDRVITTLENDPDWDSFFLDGQTQALIDYLEVKPEQDTHIRQLIADKKLRIGPWCVQPDEQMISGEATLRNLLLGRDYCNHFDGMEPVGYLADNFGHSSQLPQILNGFGLDNAVFWRGYDENQVPSSEVRWMGADGSTLLSILLVRGYSNAAGFGPEENADQRFIKNLPTVRRLSTTGHLPITEGIDHSLPPTDLGAILDAMRDQCPDLKVRHSNWESLLDAVRPQQDSFPLLEGELMYCPGLESTLSNRLNQKQANQHCEMLLTRVSEPLAALAMVDGAGYPRGFLKRAWTMMVKNAAHDSIGGAHIDLVAADVEHRYKRVEEIAGGVTHESTDLLVVCDPTTSTPEMSGRLVLFNPSPRPYSGLVECSLDLPDQQGRKWFYDFYFSKGGLTFLDGETPVVHHLLDDHSSLHPVYQDRVIPKTEDTRTLKLLLEVKALPPLGLKSLTYGPGKGSTLQNILQADGDEVTPDEKNPDVIQNLSPKLGHLRNDVIAVQVHPDGRFDLTLFASGQTWTGLNALVDEQDCGTQYNYRPAKSLAASSPAPGHITTLVNTPLRSSVRVDTEIPLFDDREGNPEQLDRRTGNRVKTILCPIAIEISIDRSSELVSITVHLDNQGAGHRLRSQFGPLTPEHRLRVNTPFDLVNRTPSYNQSRARGVTQEQMDALQGQGMQGFLVVDSDTSGFVLATRGLYEYQPLPKTEGIALTLLRSAGTINFGFEGWGSAEGGTLPGSHTMEYAFQPFQGDLFESGAMEGVDAFLAPIVGRQYPAGEAILKQGPLLSDPRLRFSTLKCTEERPSLIFRFTNVTDHMVTANIPLPSGTTKAWHCRLDETREQPLKICKGAVTVEVSAKQIMTLEFVI